MRLVLFRLFIAIALIGLCTYQLQAGRPLLALADAGFSAVMVLFIVIALSSALLKQASSLKPDQETADTPPGQRRRNALVQPQSVSDTPAVLAKEVPFEQLVARHSRPALALHRPYPPLNLPALRSHVGGLPSLPPGMAWPRAETDTGCIPAGTPLHFLAQIDLAEQPWLPKNFPKSGTAMFFGALSDGYFWGTPNDSRVLFDPASIGITANPPDDLPLMQGGFGHYCQNFGEEAGLNGRAFPQWPLKGIRIETMPDDGAIGDDGIVDYESANKFFHQLDLAEYAKVMNALSADYRKELNEFRADQAARAFGLDLPAIAKTKRPSVAELQEQPGYPWVTRLIGLWTRAAKTAQPDAPADLLELATKWMTWADSQPAGECVAADTSSEFTLLTERWPWPERGLAGNARVFEQVVLRLVREAGTDAILAENLPAIFYDFAAKEHWVVEHPCMDGQNRWEVRHHQMGGHVPSSQSAFPLDFDRDCVLQLHSDYGSEMVFCDLGEADFWIKPADLARGDFSDVEGDTRGG